MTKLYISNGVFKDIPQNNILVGEGIFETMRVEKTCISLKQFHFDRLLNGLEILGIQKPDNITPEFIEKLIRELLFRNNHTGSARVRLCLFKEPDISSSNTFNYIIESWPLVPMQLNDDGLSIGIYTGSKKQCDTLSNLKTNSRELYLQAAKFVDSNNLNDCIILNNYNRVCDTTIANIFLIKDNIIYSPSLKEGCVAGVMRRNIISKLIGQYALVEKEISIKDVREAEEVFLSNAIKGIQWVASFEEKLYTNNLTKEIYRAVFP